MTPDIPLRTDWFTRIALTVLLACASLPPAAAALPKSLAYVLHANADTVSVVDTEAGGVVATISVGDGLRASSVAVRPDGAVAYVLNGVTRTLTVIDAATREITATISLAGSPETMTFVAGGRFAYVSLACGEIAVVNTRVNRVVATMFLGDARLRGVSADGARAYAAARGRHTLAVIDTVRHAVVETIALSRAPVAVVLPAMSSMLFAIHEDGFTIVDPATSRVVGTIFASSAHAAFAVTPDGRTAYAATDGALIAIDVGSGAEVARIDIGRGSYHSLAMTADGSVLYATTETGVAVVATASNAVTEVLPVIGFSLRLSPAGSFLLVGDIALANQSVVIVDTATRRVRGTVPLAQRIDDVVFAVDDSVAYIVRDDGLSIVDTADDRIIKAFTGARPRRIGVSPNRRFAYVTLDGARTAAVIDTATNRVTATIAAPEDDAGAPFRPSDVAFSRDSRHAYVTFGRYPQSGVLAIIDTATHTITSEVPFCNPGDEDCFGYHRSPGAVVLSPDDSTAYVVLSEISVAVVDLASHRVSSIVDVGSGEGEFLTDLAITPDGSLLYAGYWFHPTDGDNPSVAVIDTASAALVGMIGLEGHAVSGVAFSSSGRTAYVGGGGWRESEYGNTGGLFSVIDVATNTVRAAVRTSDTARLSDVAFSEDGSLAFATETGTDSLVVIDAQTDEVVRRIPAGPGPLFIAVATVPDAPRLPAPRPTARPTPTRTPRVDVPPALVASVYGDAVTIIDGEIERVVPLGREVRDLTATTDGKEAYAAVGCRDDLCEGGGAVAVIDTTAGAVRDTIAVGEVPALVAVTPDGALAYAGTQRCEWISSDGETACQGTIVVIDTAARVAAARIPVPGRPTAFAIAPDGSRLYAALARQYYGGTGDIVAIDTATSAIAWTMPLEIEPSAIAVGRGGGIAYVAGQSPLQLGEIEALDTRDGRLLARLPLADSYAPATIAASPDGAFLYFGTTAGCGYALAIVDIARFTLAGYVNLPSYPRGLALTGDGRLAYVSGGRGLAVVDLEERTVVAEHRLDDISGAVSVLCDEKSCARRPSPIPRTPPAAAPTLPPLPTPTPDVCMQGRPCVRPVAVGGQPGDLVVLEVMLEPAYYSIGWLAHDLNFESDTPIGADNRGYPNCQVNPDIDKQDTTFAFLPAGCTPGQDCSGIRAVVRSIEDESAILSTAVLYRCHVRIASDAAPGSRAVAVSNVTARPPDGGGDPGVFPVDGTIDVRAAAEVTEDGAGGGSAGCSTTGAGKGPAWPVLLVAPAVLYFLRRRARNLK